MYMRTTYVQFNRLEIVGSISAIAGHVERQNRRSLGGRKKVPLAIPLCQPFSNKHEQIPWGWTTLPEGSAVKKVAVRPGTISTMDFGIVGAVICRRYDVHRLS